MRLKFFSWTRVAACAAITPGLFAQTASTAAVTGVGGFSNIVENVETSLKFYQEGLGLQLTTPPRPFDSTAWIMQMGNTPGAQSRPAILKIPGSALGIELIDYKNIDRKPAHPRLQDPGAATLVLKVDNLDATVARLQTNGGSVVSQDGKAAWIKDPDSFYVNLVESSDTSQGPAGFAITIENTEATMRIYRDVLGFEPHSLSFEAGALSRRMSVAAIPGTSVQMQFLEFNDKDRHPLHTRVQDPGTAILQLAVHDIDRVVERLKAAGATIVSEGGKPVDAPNHARFCLVRDPNNLFLELFERPGR